MDSDEENAGTRNHLEDTDLTLVESFFDAPAALLDRTDGRMSPSEIIQLLKLQQAWLEYLVGIQVATLMETRVDSARRRVITGRGDRKDNISTEQEEYVRQRGTYVEAAMRMLHSWTKGVALKVSSYFFFVGSILVFNFILPFLFLCL